MHNGPDKWGVLRREAYAVGHDGVTPPAQGENARGFVGLGAVAWPAGADGSPPNSSLPDGATAALDDSGAYAGYIELRTGVMRRKSAAKRADRVVSAEDSLAALIIDALQKRTASTRAADAAGGAGGAGAAAAGEA
eukprot:5354386-Prymnesium_polylepis.1